MSPTTFIVIRHGDTAYNQQGLIQGQLDIPLSQQGMRQAKVLRARLYPYRDCPIYSSDLSRSHCTARLALPEREAVLLAELRERNFGDWQGQAYPHGEAEQAMNVRNIDHRPCHGESYRQLRQRGVDIIKRLAATHTGETVLVFSHGGLLRSVLSWALGLPGERVGRFRLANTSLSVFQLDTEGIPWVQSLNDVTHLNALEEGLTE